MASIVSIQGAPKSNSFFFLPCGFNCFYTVSIQLFISLPNDMGLMNEAKTRSQQSRKMFRSLQPVGHILRVLQEQMKV